MSTEELRKAVEALGKVLAFAGSENQEDWQTIRQALRDQEAEIGRLTYRLEAANAYGEQCDNDIRALLDRAEKAEALLRDIKAWDVGEALNPKRESLFAIPLELRQRITAHLGGENNG